jgi:erythromycin esterase-like protein
VIGFTTYTGMVAAASMWGGLAERKYVGPALAGSWEQLFHEQGLRRFLVEPLERTSDWEVGELPETYPWGV